MKKIILIAMIAGAINAFGQVISSSTLFSLSICSDSTVKSWGINNTGELGIGYISTGGCQCNSLPVNVLGLNQIVAISGGTGFALALKSDGTVWSWGSSGGTGSFLQRFTPMQVNGISNVVKIAAGQGHSMAIKQDGTLWTWGMNYFGELGNGTATTTGCQCDTIPAQVNGLTNVIDIAADYNSSIALKADGTVWSWGRNTVGNLGDSTNIDRLTPVRVYGLSGVTAISAGSFHCLALKNDGTIWAWGDNSNKALGDSTNINRNYPVHSKGLSGITAISAGAYYSLALKNDGTVWFYGNNYSGQGGNGLVDTSGCRCDSVPTQVSFLNGITAISAASDGEHSLARKNDGTLWSWGGNRFGQLGNGTINSLNSAVLFTDFPCGCDSLPGQVFSLCPVIDRKSTRL